MLTFSARKRIWQHPRNLKRPWTPCPCTTNFWIDIRLSPYRLRYNCDISAETDPSTPRDQWSENPTFRGRSSSLLGGMCAQSTVNGCKRAHAIVACTHLDDRAPNLYFSKNILACYNDAGVMVSLNSVYLWRHAASYDVQHSFDRFFGTLFWSIPTFSFNAYCCLQKLKSIQS